LSEVLKNDFIIISISCQNLRSLARQLNEYDLNGKTLLLAMKGLEEPSAQVLSEVFEAEIKQNIHIATLSGPGHVEDYMRNVPSAAVIDSKDPQTQDYVIKLIKFYS
jgi:glycerol-3-phosphate dehydrogenase (NAD(P)+)